MSQHLLASINSVDYATIVLYLLVVVGIGLWFSRGGSDTDGYLLGGRGMPWWLIGISYVVSLLSTLTLVGVPGEAYANGLTMALASLMLPIFSVIAFHVFVRFYFIQKVFTPFDYLERRFSPTIRVIAAGFFWLSRAIYLGLVLYASAKVFAGADNWPVPFTIVVIGVVGTLYTILGGFKAVVWSDFIQFVVLTAGIALIMVYAIADIPQSAFGVLTHAFENQRGMPELSDPSFYGFSFTARVTLVSLIAVTVNEQLFYNSADQIALQRLLSTSSYRQARRSLFTFALIVTPVILVLWYLGLVMFAFYGNLPEQQRPASGDTAIFTFITNELPAPIPGLILSAMLAAIMSTLDSGINSLATVATKDFYLRFFKRGASESSQVMFSRGITLGTGLLAILIGLGLSMSAENMGTSVLETSMAWMTLSVALPPVFLLGMFSRRATPADAVIQLAVGWLVTASMLIWYHLSQSDDGGGISFLMVGIPGPVISLILGWVITRRHPRQPDSQLRGLTIWSLN